MKISESIRVPCWVFGPFLRMGLSTIQPALQGPFQSVPLVADKGSKLCINIYILYIYILYTLYIYIIYIYIIHIYIYIHIIYINYTGSRWSMLVTYSSVAQ